MRIFFINVHVEIKMLILSILIAWTLPGLPWSPAWSDVRVHFYTQMLVLSFTVHIHLQTDNERERESKSCGLWQGKWMARVTAPWVLDEERESERAVKDILNLKRVRGWKIDGHVSSALGEFRTGSSPSLRAYLTSCPPIFLGIHCGRVWRSVPFLCVPFKSTQLRSVPKPSELPL